MDAYDDVADKMQERASGGGRGSSARKGRGGSRRGGGGGGGGGGANREVQVSKALSTLLRHQAVSAGIPLDDEGFAPLDRVMQWPRLRSLNATLAEIKDSVSTNAKQRFSLKLKPEAAAAGEDNNNDNGDRADRWLIRANQGHSIALASEGLHAPITLEAGNVPEVVVHGTYFAFWPAIVAAGGLKKMGRTHVHFGTALPDDDNPAGVHQAEDEDGGGGSGKSKVISGMRADAELLIFVDVAAALRDAATSAASEQDGGEGKGVIKWWLSENNVVLTEGDAEGVVPLKYFKEVRGRRQGVGVLWKDGVKVADLPDGVVARVPHGKGPGRGGGGGDRGRGGRRGGGRGRGRG